MATKNRTSLKNDFANGKYATGEKFADLIDSMKVVQLPVVDPQALGTSLSFIDSISQDADGKITATKKTLDLENAHELNPFKGWYKTGDTLPTDGFDGAYLYFKDTSELTGQTTIYRWNGTTYADTGTVVDTSNVQTFETGQAVNGVAIDDTQFANPASNALAKATDTQKLAVKLEGVTAEEEKVNYIDGSLITGHYVGANGSTEGTSSNYDCATFDVEGYEYVRFLGIGFSSSGYSRGFAFYDSEGNYLDNTYKEYDVAEDGVSKAKQYLESIPQGAKYFKTNIRITSVVTSENFYCYLRKGESVINLIPKVADNLTTDDSTKALSAKQGMILKQSLSDTYVNETKVDEITPISNGRVTGDQGVVGAGSSTKYAVIDITGYPKVRFRGLNMYKTSSYINTGYQFGHYEDENFVVDESYFYPHTEEGSSNKVIDIVANVPEGSTHLRTNVSYSSLALNDFYCYLRDDNTVITDKYLQEISKKPIKIDWNEVLDTMESPYGRGTMMNALGDIVATASRNTIELNLPLYKYIKFSCIQSSKGCVLKFVDDNDVTIGPIFKNNKDNTGRIEGLVELQQYKVLGATKCVLCTSNSSISDGTVVTVFTNEDEFNSGVYLGNLKSDVEELKGKVEGLEEYIEQTEDTTDILYLNDDKEFLPKMMSAKKRYYTSQIQNKYHPVVIAHISDVHGNFGNVDRFLRFCDHYSQYIDIKLNTGDIVLSNFSDGVEGYNSDNIINIIGNHDVSSNGGNPTVNPDNPTQNEVYNRFIKPWVSNWGVTQPDGAEANGYCYFYKDFNNQKLRLVCVDILNYDSTENTWLESVLSNAKTNGYHVVIATHFAGSQQSANDVSFEKINCGYSTRYNITGSGLYSMNGYAYHMIEAVQSFIDNEGSFVGYLSGHFHSDFIAKVEDYPNQLIYSIGATKAGEMRDFNHVAGTRMQDEFQIVSINTDLNIIKLFKVGANWDAYGQKRDSICIRYITGEIIGEEFRTDIATNASNISTNAGNIDSNSDNIDTNAGEIADIKAFLATKFPSDFPSEQTGE